MNEKLVKKLKDREEKGTKRSLSSCEGMIDFISNDYLGFANEFLVDDVHDEKGATGSRLISGNNLRLEELEKEITVYFGFQSGLFFNSGYDANLGIFSSIPQRGDVVLYDEYVHASIRDGIRLSFAESYSFRHNDLVHLEDRLKTVSGDNVFIAIEGLYSMNGDVSPLKEIDRLAAKYNAVVIIDEAHSAGVYGNNGVGVLADPDEYPSVGIKLVTFGKAFGSHGAIVLTDHVTKEYLINFARSFIYTTALPNAGFEKVLRILKSGLINERREELLHMIKEFRARFLSQNIQSDEFSPIQIIEGLTIQELQQIQSSAKNDGLALKAIFSPTVPQGKECLRLSLHSFSSLEELDKLKKYLQ